MARWHGGKGSNIRPEFKKNSFRDNFDKIDFSAQKKAREEQEAKLLAEQTKKPSEINN